jgi:hypothetical protein
MAGFLNFLICMTNIGLFLLYCFGLGYALTRNCRKAGTIEDVILQLGLGLAAIPVLGVILSRLHIPLDWRLFLFLACIVPVYDLINSPQRLTLKSCRRLEIIEIGVILIFLFNAWTYCFGAFAYPWLEDDDSWSHAAGIKYIAIEKNVQVVSGLFHYINPYPPGYDLIIGILHQTNPSLYFTLKFFNAFIVALSFLFFYAFVAEYSGDKKIALTSTFILSLIPCYLSHFIWAHALIIPLFFITFTAIKKTWDDSRYIISAAVSLSAVFLTQPTQSIKFVILLLLLILTCGFSRMSKVIKKTIVVFFLGTVLSLFWWGPVIKDTINGNSRLAARQRDQVSAIRPETGAVTRGLFSPRLGTATREYKLTDYLFLPKHNLVNNPTGIGLTLCILALLGFFSSIVRFKYYDKQRKIFIIFMIFWLVFSFLGMNTATFHFPVGLFAFRFWMLFAIPIAVFVAEAIFALLMFVKNRYLKVTLIVLILINIIFTSGKEKYRINNGIWPWGIYWKSKGELRGYLWLKKNLKPNTKVFAFQDNLFVIGQDMHADYWSSGYKESFEDAINLEIQNLYNELKKHKFQYLIIGQREVKKFGLDIVNDKIIELVQSNLFEIIYIEEKSVCILKVL